MPKRSGTFWSSTSSAASSSTSYAPCTGVPTGLGLPKDLGCFPEGYGVCKRMNPSSLEAVLWAACASLSCRSQGVQGQLCAGEEHWVSAPDAAQQPHKA